MTQTKMNTVTLGISPGSRHFGTALMVDNDLHIARVRTIFGKTGQAKIEGMVAKVESIIKERNVSVLSVKINPANSTSEAVETFILGLRAIAENYGLPLHIFTMEELAKKCAFEETQPFIKRALAVSILYRYPHLRPEYSKLYSKNSRYYYKLFEAIACAICAPKP